MLDGTKTKPGNPQKRPNYGKKRPAVEKMGQETRKREAEFRAELRQREEARLRKGLARELEEEARRRSSLRVDETMFRRNLESR